MAIDYTPTKREYTPKQLFAGVMVPTPTAEKEASADVKAHAPVLLDEDGKIKPVTSGDLEKLTGLYGITADSAATGEIAVVYLGGEFNAAALELESGVTADKLEVAFRNIGILLKNIPVNP